MEILETTQEMVQHILQKINTSKSPGPDQLHPRLLSELYKHLSYPLHIIYNTSLRTSTLPTEWKLAWVSAIFKKGDKKLASNYRPISLTCIACKCMESIIRTHITNHMKINNLLSNRQYGFISGRSTTLQLLNVLDLWTLSLDNGHQTDVIYMDFQKAFDKVPHKHLISKLASYGISQQIIDWTRNFLSDRQQKVIVNGKASKIHKVTSGIPQGSVLGPLLFVLYINDMPELVTSHVYLFADDTKIFRTITSVNGQIQLQQDINTLIEWSNTWLLKFHPEKCKHMSIWKSNILNIPRKYNMTLENKLYTLSTIELEKDLGVTFDPQLTFEAHINGKINTATRMWKVVRNTFQFLDRYMFIPLYKTLVRSHLDYAMPVWSPHLKKHIIAIENVQRRATKQLPGITNLSYEHRLRILGLPTLTYRRYRGDMIECYKITHGLYDNSVTPYLPKWEDFTDREGHSHKGHKYKLYTLRTNKNTRKNAFPIRIITNWNSLSKKVVESNTLNSFKTNLDKHWSNQEVVYNFEMEIKT